MKKVQAYVGITMGVTCPECNHFFDANCYDHDQGGVLLDNLMENTQNSCTEMDFEVTCKECSAEFIMDEFEY